MEKRILQAGTAAIALALALRLFGNGVMETTVQALDRQALAQIFLFWETGRVVRTRPPQTAPQETAAPAQPEETLPEIPEKSLAPATFSREDGDLVQVRNSSGYTVDIEEALLQPLSWELTGGAPTVLILHTHGTESYVNDEGYSELSAYRSLDENYNMVSVGDRLAQQLEKQGICVLHDRTLHDYPSYNGSYSLSRETVSEYLTRYPSIRLVLDLHRDAVADASGGQVGYTLSTDRGTAAKIMLVLGSDTVGLSYPNWQENFALGVKLHAQLEKNQPGICRDLCLRASRYNQDLTPGMVLLEIGTAGNTRQEALLSADILAQAIADLSYGAEGAAANS